MNSDGQPFFKAPKSKVSKPHEHAKLQSIRYATCVGETLSKLFGASSPSIGSAEPAWRDVPPNQPTCDGKDATNGTKGIATNGANSSVFVTRSP